MDYNWQNYTVLIVEDDEICYKYIELVLSRKTGINIIWAATGKEAVDYCKVYDHIDIVLMDIQLPGINGYDATRQIKSGKPNLPVIIQSANTLNEELEKCIDIGCEAYVTKPIDISLLFQKMDSLLNTVPSNRIFIK
ncbi:MAG: response regulator [Bacteroidales bacterium]|nr:MAG: response regulator [Bacteroidales bacterium]